MSDSAVQASEAQSRRLPFDRYVLDLDRGCLLRDGKEIGLRPKTFGVLHHLVANAGRLVTKRELFAAVWPNVVTTDDVLVQSIGELRRALGDDGARLIRTVPRRGYRFVADTAPAPRPLGGRRTLWALCALVLIAAVTLWMVLGTGRDAAPVAKPAVAVLALVDHSDEPGREYFADGLTQDIINALGRFSRLTVMSWNAVLPYKGQHGAPQRLGRELGVAYLVEGSVRHIGDRVRVTAQLVDAREGRVLFSARFDEALEDIFALQDRITEQIVSTLAIRVTEIELRKSLVKPTSSLAAYDYVLRARPVVQRPTRAELATARSLLRRAIALDPHYAAAYATLAETYYIATSMGWAESPAAFMARAEELATKAVSLDPSELRARVILGRIHLFHQRHKEAENEIERAIAINPNDAPALAGRGNILMWLGRTDAALEALERAQRLDPELNGMDRFALSLAYYLKRRYSAAIEQAERNLRDHAHAHFNRAVLAAAFAQDNRPDEAAQAAKTMRSADPTFDPGEFGTKLLNEADLAHLREGLRKAGL
jgi:adenylate cyclase